MKKSILRLDMIVLQVLSRSDNYGYEIVSDINTTSSGMINIKEGVLYPILYKLVKSGSILSYKKTVKGRERIYYSITDEGKDSLIEMKKEYYELTQAINTIIREDN